MEENESHTDEAVTTEVNEPQTNCEKVSETDVNKQPQKSKWEASERKFIFII